MPTKEEWAELERRAKAYEQAWLAEHRMPAMTDDLETARNLVRRLSGPMSDLNGAEKAEEIIATALRRVREEERAETGRLREALRTISRMRTMPDHAMNTATLSAAHRIAQDALDRMDGEG